jgi:hypothetical protein
MRNVSYSCDCCGKKVADGYDCKIVVPFGADMYHHLCISCANKNISSMITGHYPSESQELVRLLMGGESNPDNLKLRSKKKNKEVSGLEDEFGDPSYNTSLPRELR